MNFFSSKNVSHILSILQHMMLHHHFLRQKTFITFTAFNLSLFSCMVGNIMVNFFSSKNVSRNLSMLQHMMLHHFLRQKHLSHLLHLIFHSLFVWYSTWCFVTFLVKKRFSHLLHFEFMVQPMMLHYFLRQKRFFAFTACYSTWCFIIFFVKKRLSHFMHLIS